MPSFGESFTNVPWSAGNYLYENRLDQMVNNDKYLRENHGYPILVSADIFDAGIWSDGSSPTAIFHVTIDGGSTVHDFGTWTQTTTPTSRDAKDIVLSTTEGLHYLGMAGRRFYFVKSSEIDYVSIWLTTYMKTGVSAGSYDYQYFLNYNVTIIGHRLAEGW
jgi:hypothetical protein